MHVERNGIKLEIEAEKDIFDEQWQHFTVALNLWTADETSGSDQLWHSIKASSFLTFQVRSLSRAPHLNNMYLKAHVGSSTDCQYLFEE